MHWVLGDDEGAIAWGSTRDWEEIELLSADPFGDAVPERVGERVVHCRELDVERMDVRGAVASHLDRE